MRKRFLPCMMLVLFLLCSCKAQTEPQPQYSADEVIQRYLDAVKKQDGLTMAKYTLDHSGVDFTISAEEAKALGLSQDSMQKLYKHLLNFSYQSEQAIQKGSNTEIKVHITAYDFQEVLSDIVKEKKESFQKINGSDLSEKKKNQKIADMIITEFKNAERTYRFDIVFHLQLAENEWLIDPKDEAKLLEKLFLLK